jgi:hypothetical protein
MHPYRLPNTHSSRVPNSRLPPAAAAITDCGAVEGAPTQRSERALLSLLLPICLADAWILLVSSMAIGFIESLGTTYDVELINLGSYEEGGIEEAGRRAHPAVSAGSASCACLL